MSTKCVIVAIKGCRESFEFQGKVVVEFFKRQQFVFSIIMIHVVVIKIVERLLERLIILAIWMIFVEKDVVCSF